MAVPSHTLGPGGSSGFFRGYFGRTLDGLAEFPFLPLGFPRRTCSRVEKDTKGKTPWDLHGEGLGALRLGFGYTA